MSSSSLVEAMKPGKFKNRRGGVVGAYNGTLRTKGVVGNGKALTAKTGLRTSSQARDRDRAYAFSGIQWH
jgi:hypothetical protein